MNILIKMSGGHNIVLRPQARPRWYPAATAPAASVEIWWGYADESFDKARFAGSWTPGQSSSFPYVPDMDRNVRLYLVSRSADGTPSVSTLEDAVQATLIHQRETAAPTIAQIGASTAGLISIAVGGFTRFARKRKIRLADNAAMNNASVTIRESTNYVNRELPRVVDIARVAGIVPAFTWAGNDPAANGFTKQGTGTTAASSSPAGWKITTTGTDGSTYYTKDNWPANAFQNGFTLEVTPPTVNASDGAALPNQSVCVRVEDGAKRYELTFSGTNVQLNGGTSRAHNDKKVRLVLAAGGNAADLWIGDSKVEDDTAGAATGTSGLSFGDLALADDSEAIWKRIEYALTPQDVKLAQTIYVGVSHSGGGAFGAESAITSFTFASEGGAGGSQGSSDPYARDRYDLA